MTSSNALLTLISLVPEGHTIHRLAQDLNRSFRGKDVRASSPPGRFDDGAARLDDQNCVGFEAFGKHLVGHFASGDVLHVHLGLIGKFRPTIGEPIGAVRLRLSYDDDHWDLRGPMVCTVGAPELAGEVASSVGPDPLHRSAGHGKAEQRFVDAMKRRRVAAGAALLDQKVIAGIGNVYRAELLFLAGIDPATPANSIDDNTLADLWDLTVAQLKNGKRLNRIVTVDPADVGSSSTGRIPAGERLYVYKRRNEPCRRCDTPIVRTEVAGRKMWSCPQCQR